MKMRLVTPVLITTFAFAALASTAVQGAEKKWDFAIESAAQFEEQAVEIRQQIDAGQYPHVEDRDRAAVEADLNRVSRLLNKRDELSQLSHRDQVELMNAQERINAILIDNDADRVVCKLEAKVGTRMKTKNCLTVREWAMVQSAADRTARDIQRAGGKLPNME